MVEPNKLLEHQCKTLLGITAGMAVLQDAGILHLDLKPANILFAIDGGFGTRFCLLVFTVPIL